VNAIVLDASTALAWVFVDEQTIMHVSAAKAVLPHVVPYAALKMRGPTFDLLLSK